MTEPGLPCCTWAFSAAAAAKSLQSCLTLCNPLDGSPPGSPVPGILQARTLEWVAISFSNAWKWKVKVKSLSLVRLLATPWTAAHQAPPSMGFSRQEYWSGVPLELSPVAAKWCYSLLLSAGFSLCWLLLLEGTGSRDAGVGSNGAWAQLPHGMWDLPGPGMESMSPASAGRFLTTEPPGRSHSFFYNIELNWSFSLCNVQISWYRLSKYFIYFAIVYVRGSWYIQLFNNDVICLSNVEKPKGRLLSRRRQWHPTLVLLPGKSHGWRSLVGCSPGGC